jgi:hypothetical protein
MAGEEREPMATERDERWIFGHALHQEDPGVSSFTRSTLYSKASLAGESGWILAAVPTPNATEGWKIASVMLRYTIKGGAGYIDKVGVRDGDRLVHSFEGLTVGLVQGWQTLTLQLPEPEKFTYGVGVSIHLQYSDFLDVGQDRTAEFLFASVGLGFVKI